MVQYLVILLDDTSVSYCHADNPNTERKLISIEHLKAGIHEAMRQNWMIQFVYPDYELPQEYLDVIDTIDHHDIFGIEKSNFEVENETDSVSVMDYSQLATANIQLSGGILVLRLTKKDLFDGDEKIAALLPKVERLNIVITDLDTFTDSDIERYKIFLANISDKVKALYLGGATPQFNLLTDRIMLSKPNHCNAGVENITLAPNGKFYICPAFYYSNPDDSIGDIKSFHETSELQIPNQQLFRLDHAPLCRHCDAYHCRRCVWLNRKTTLEVNTPSREQCVVAHTEREASRLLLAGIREKASFMPETEIKEINYNDPFEVRKEW